MLSLDVVVVIVMHNHLPGRWDIDGRSDVAQEFNKIILIVVTSLDVFGNVVAALPIALLFTDRCRRVVTARL